jgi:hypothetical protein
MSAYDLTSRPSRVGVCGFSDRSRWFERLQPQLRPLGRRSKQMARRYRWATKTEKGRMLDELCELTGWSRRHARPALAEALSDKAAPRPQQRPRAQALQQ